MSKAVRVFRGDTWKRAWVIETANGAPVNLTGASARLQVRNAAGMLVMEATQANGRISLTPLAGRVDLTMPKEAMEVAPGSYRFDLEVTYANGERQTYEQNTLVVLEDVTRDG